MASFPKLSYVCPMPWTEMRGDERARFCSKCARTVVNLSLLTEAQRATLLAQTQPEELCVAYYQRLSGEHVSAEKPLKEAETRSIVQYGLAALGIGAAAVAVTCVPAASEAVEEAEARLKNSYYALKDEVLLHAEFVKARLGGQPLPGPLPGATMTLGMIACPPSPSLTPSAPTPASSPDADQGLSDEAMARCEATSQS